jgi:hypothetical protein
MTLKTKPVLVKLLTGIPVKGSECLLLIIGVLTAKDYTQSILAK